MVVEFIQFQDKRKVQFYFGRNWLTFYIFLNCVYFEALAAGSLFEMIIKVIFLALLFLRIVFGFYFVSWSGSHG